MSAVTVDAALALFAGRIDESDFLASIADPIERWEASRFFGDGGPLQGSYKEGYKAGEAAGIEQGEETGHEIGYDLGLGEGIERATRETVDRILAYLDASHLCSDELFFAVEKFLTEEL